jgi:2-dehydropantoate 2-reductase
LERLQKKGISIHSRTFGNFTACPQAELSLSISPDFLFITTKAPSLLAAAESVRPEILKKDTLIVPLLNGFEHLAILKKRYGNRVVAGSISIEVSRDRSGEIIHTSDFAKIRLASDGDTGSAVLHACASWLIQAGFEVEIGRSEADVIWEKLARLNAIACATAATDQPIGVLRQDASRRSDILSMVSEASEVAKREDIEILPSAVMKKIDSIGAGQMSSLQRDVVAGYESELDAIAGAIVRRAAKYGLLCPTISRYIQLIESKSKANV